MWFLCVFFHRLLDYRRAEVESLAVLFGSDGDGNRSLEWKLPEGHHIDSPFHFVSLPSEDIAKKIANRSEFGLSFGLSFEHLLMSFDSFVLFSFR